MSKKLFSITTLAATLFLFTAVCLSCFFFVNKYPRKSFALESDVMTYSKASDGETSLSKNFKVKEFACNDGSDEILIDPELVVILQTIRDHFGKPVNITSAYRSPAYNAEINGAPQSYHVRGMAADIVVTGVSPEEVAKYAETIGVRGIGRYSTDSDGYFCHVDSRASKSYWIGQSSTWTATHGGSFNTQPYAWPTLNQGITNADVILKKGDNNSSVKQLQASLNSLLGLSLDVDGIFGAQTEIAVKQFQSTYGLTADGIVGATTIEKINHFIKNGLPDNDSDDSTEEAPSTPTYPNDTPNDANDANGDGLISINCKSAVVSSGTFIIPAVCCATALLINRKKRK